MKNKIIPSLLGFWLYFFCVVLIGNTYFAMQWKLICEICQILNIIIIIGLSGKVYFNLFTNERKLFILFIISNCFLLLGEVIFFIVSCVLKITDIDQLISLDYLTLPFIFWTCFGAFYWIMLTWNNLKVRNYWFVNVAILLINLCFAYMISKLHVTSSARFLPLTIYSNIVSFIIINCALYTLICARSFSMKLIASGSICLIAINFLTWYMGHIVNPSTLVYKNDFWFFSSSIVISGLLHLIVKKEYTQFESFIRWRSIKSILTAWTLCIVVLTASLFLFLDEFFDILTSQILSILPYFMFIYIIFAAFLSLIIVYVFEKSIEQLNIAVKHFLKEPYAKKRASRLNIAEFMVLNDFLKFTINIIAEKNKVKDQISQLAGKVAHDIRSPISSLLMIAKFSTDIPENTRIVLREAITRIDDIANSLLKYYTPLEDVDLNSLQDKSEAMLVSAAIMQIITEKKYECQHLQVKITYDITQDGYFAFIKIEDNAFKRMLSNLINNSINAVENRHPGLITIKLDTNDQFVTIHIEDNGKGIEPAVIDKLRQKVALTVGKKDGHGIGLVQVRETLDAYKGTLDIESVVDNGTKVILTFPRIDLPDWIVSKIKLQNDDIIVILDDDSSIHGAWGSRFKSILMENPNISIQHFSIGLEALEFIKSLSANDQDRVFLLCDYELLGQNFNGIEIIEQSELKRSILVTSHYADIALQASARHARTTILPKKLASEVAIEVELDALIDTNVPLNKNKEIDFIILDDDETFVASLLALAFKGLNVIKYHDPAIFLAEIGQFPFDTKIILDRYFYELEDCDTDGVEIAIQLNKIGFTNLYLMSGENISRKLGYLTVILKSDIDSIKKLADSARKD